jgi:hypothetical protein
MNNRKKIGLIIGVFTLMFLLVWLVSRGDNPSAQTKRKPFVSSNWTSRFQLYDKKPMGLFLFNSLLSAHVGKSHNVYIANDYDELDSLSMIGDSTKTYLFVGNIFGVKNQEIDSIVSKVKKGSRLFLSYNQMTDNIFERFFTSYKEAFDYTDEINVFADGKRFNMINLYQNDTIACNWKTFNNVTSDNKFEGLTSFMQLDNFIKMEIDSGYAYFQCTPNLFFNYQIKRNDGFLHTTFVLNQLPKQQDVILLEFGRLSDNYGNQDVDIQEGTEGREDDSYLKLIFSNPSLLAAMLMSVLGVFLFVIFRSKRMRPIVPVVPEKKNMTLAFAETITSIYFAKQNPYGMLQVQKKNFYEAIRKHFYIELKDREDNTSVEVLAEKSGKSILEINDILNSLETKEAFSVTEASIIDVSKRKRKFYLETGIINEKTIDRLEAHTFLCRRPLLIPYLLIIGGIALFMLGIYFLMQSIGVGVLFWPIGFVSLLLGVARISNPLLKSDMNAIMSYSVFGRKRTVYLSDIIRIEQLSNATVLHVKDQKPITILNRDISRFDKSEFKRFIIKLHKFDR